MQTKLRNSIDQLQLEIDKLDDIDESSRSKLNTIIEGLERKLNSDGHDEEDLSDRIGEEIRDIEIAHPALTKTLNGIMSILSNLGI